MWHVWHWNGKQFDLVWHDLTREDAEHSVSWRNERAERQESVTRYVMARDGESPVLP